MEMIMEPKDAHGEPKDFDSILKNAGIFPLKACGLETLQINMGRVCNQSCTHCHVEAGPQRTEMISGAILEKCLKIVDEHGIETVDLTGGSPEMNPNFRWFVTECARRSVRLVVRTNLTIMLETGYEDVPELLRANRVELMASLPCYTQSNVDKQRGGRVFERSIKALGTLNALGYGKPGSGLILNLVYNPGGPSLPGDQQSLENDYRKQLGDQFGIVFNSLFTIANLPIGRFGKRLRAEGQFDEYMTLLTDAFNPRSVERVMCRKLLSVGWDGSLYDCDFNQVLLMRCDHGAPDHIENFDAETLRNRRIATGRHCFGCTAGSGSSCYGALTGTPR
jgi:radical SAM/Cys-rich protein